MRSCLGGCFVAAITSIALGGLLTGAAAEREAPEVRSALFWRNGPQISMPAMRRKSATYSPPNSATISAASPSATTKASAAFCIVRWKTGRKNMLIPFKSRKSWFGANLPLFASYGHLRCGRSTLRDHSRNQLSPVWTYSAGSRTEAGRSYVILPMRSNSGELRR